MIVWLERRFGLSWEIIETAGLKGHRHRYLARNKEVGGGGHNFKGASQGSPVPISRVNPSPTSDLTGLPGNCIGCILMLTGGKRRNGERNF